MALDKSEPTTYKLSLEEKQFYEDNGYLVIKGLIGKPTLDTLRNRFLQVVKKEVPRGRIAVIEDIELKKKTDKPEEYVNKINQLNYDEEFMKYTEHPRLLDVLSQLLSEEQFITNSMLINKPPGTPCHPVHQDGYHIPYCPIERIITTWTAIDPANKENGCLFVIPGSHKAQRIYAEKMLPGFVNSLFFVIKDEEKIAPMEQRVSLIVEPGDTVFLHALMVHGSWSNDSKRCRKAITCVYSSSQCQYFDVSETVQETFKIEFEKELQSRGFKGTYQEFWESRRKLIRKGNA